MIMLQRILRRCTLLFLFLISILTCSHIPLCQHIVERPPQSQSSLWFLVPHKKVEVHFCIIRHTMLTEHQTLRIFFGANAVNKPTIAKTPIIVIIHTVEEDMSILSELSEVEGRLISTTFI